MFYSAHMRVNFGATLICEQFTTITVIIII